MYSTYLFLVSSCFLPYFLDYAISSYSSSPFRYLFPYSPISYGWEPLFWIAPYFMLPFRHSHVSICFKWVHSHVCESDSELQILVRSQKSLLLVRNRMRRWWWGHLFVCSCDSAVRFLDAEISSQRRLLLCLSGAAPSALRSALDSSIQACAD